MNALDYVNHQRLLKVIGEAIDTNVALCTTVDEMEYFAKTILDSYVFKGVIQSYQLNYDAQDGKLDVMITPIKAVEKVDVWFPAAGLHSGVVTYKDVSPAEDVKVGYTGVITEGKPIIHAPFAPVLMPIIRNLMPDLIAQQIIGVQPMMGYEEEEVYPTMAEELATTLGY